MKLTKKIMAISVITASILLAACNNDSSKADKTDKTTNKAKQLSSKEIKDISYSIGNLIGNSYSAKIKSQDIDKTTLTNAFEASIDGKKSKYTQEEMQQILKSYQAQEQIKAKKELMAAIIKNKNELLNNPNTPFVGKSNSKVAVIEFFDYNCRFCHELFPVLKSVMKNDSNNVKYIFKSYPIFGRYWKSSNLAAQAGTAIYKAKGSSAYIDYHNSIFELGRGEGKLTNSDIKGVISKINLNFNKIQEMINVKSSKENINTPKHVISNVMKLGIETLKIDYTPALIVMPTTGANLENTTFIPGLTSQKTIEAAITKAMKS